MQAYKLIPGSRFSREWRRNKTYTEPELRMLCRRRGCSMDKRRDAITIKKGVATVATLRLVQSPVVPAEEPEEQTESVTRMQAFAALKL